MTTGSLCLTEILKSWKSCSSKRLASHTALSTSASGVALPYFSSNRGSSEPAFTPIRIEMPASAAARAMAPTWSSNLRMLPGFTRTAAQPASIAAKTYLGWKWMSAMTGICDFLAIAGNASASSWLGQATRTMSQPVAVSSAICWSVASTSVVGVVVIDWTLTGASPPTSTLPTRILRDFRRGASTGGGIGGMPSATFMVSFSARSAGEADRVEQGDRHVEARQQQHERGHPVGQADVGGGDLATDPAGPDDADGAVDFTLAAAERGLPYADHPLRDGHDRLGRLRGEVAEPRHRSADVLRDEHLRRRDTEEADGLEPAGRRAHAVVVRLAESAALGGDHVRHERDLATVALHDDLDRAGLVVADQVLHGAPRRDIGSVERHQPVTGSEARCGRRCGGIIRRAGPISVRDRDHAGRHLADDRPELGLARVAVGHQHDAGEHRGDEDVHGRPAEHDDELLPPPLAVEQAVLVAGLDLLLRGATGIFDQCLERTGAGTAQAARVVARLGRKHADHAHVAAEWDRLEAVLRLTAPARPHGAAEADHVLADLDPEQLRRYQVTDLVQRDGEQQPERKGHDADHGEPVHAIRLSFR